MTEMNYEVVDNRLDTERNLGIIFVHGSGGTHEVWKKQMNNIAAKVVVVNLPGHLEAHSAEMPDMETYVSAINKLLDNLKFDKVFLAGHSMGGAVALSYYLKHSDKVNGLILIGTGARLRVLPAILELSKTSLSEMIKFTGKIAYHKESVLKNSQLIEDHRKEILQNAPQIVHNDYMICNNFDIMDKLEEIKVPTLIICGDDDKMTPVKYSKYMHDHINSSEMHIVEKAGHMVMLEQADIVNKLINEFLARFQ